MISTAPQPHPDSNSTASCLDRGTRGRQMFGEGSTMDAARYTIRLRHAGVRGTDALLVVDRCGTAHLCLSHGIVCHLGDAQRLAHLEPVLRQRGWVPVPPVAPYTLDELLRLLAPLAA